MHEWRAMKLCRGMKKNLFTVPTAAKTVMVSSVRFFEITPKCHHVNGFQFSRGLPQRQ
jgi:hypothetical protein